MILRSHCEFCGSKLAYPPDAPACTQCNKVGCPTCIANGIVCRSCSVTMGPPELLGSITPRQELTVIPQEGPKRIGWSCYELTGTDIYRPHGHPITLENMNVICQPENLITTQTGLVDGEELLVQDLFGWNIGVISLSGKTPTCSSPNGKLLFMIQFVDDRPSPEPPRWVCTGTANLAGLRKLEVTP